MEFQAKTVKSWKTMGCYFLLEILESLRNLDVKLYRNLPIGKLSLRSSSQNVKSNSQNVQPRNKDWPHVMHIQSAEE